MVIQLFIFALIFFGLAVWFFVRNKKVLGFTFIALGIMLTVIFFIVRFLYPHKVPF
jgi:hypothetical protein